MRLSPEEIQQGGALFLAAWQSGDEKSPESRVYDDWEAERMYLPSIASAVVYAAAELARESGAVLDEIAITAYISAGDRMHRAFIESELDRKGAE